MPQESRPQGRGVALWIEQGCRRRCGLIVVATGLLLWLSTGCASPQRAQTVMVDADPSASVASDSAEATSEIKPSIDARATATPVSKTRSVDLGHSVRQSPLRMQVFGDGEETVLVIGGIHGSEPTGAYVAKRLGDYLYRHPEAYADRTVAVIAAANPDGVLRRRRRNANGVDLNRNFPAENWSASRESSRYHGGPEPASEPETRALIAAIESLRPALIISIHSIARGRHCNNFDGPAQRVAELMTVANGYPTRATIGYPTPGSLGSWAGQDRHIPTITLELPRDLSGSSCWDENRTALLAAIQAERVDVGK